MPHEGGGDIFGPVDGQYRITLEGPDADKFVVFAETLFRKAGAPLNFQRQSALNMTVVVEDRLAAGGDRVSTAGCSIDVINEGAPFDFVEFGVRPGDLPVIAARTEQGFINTQTQLIGEEVSDPRGRLPFALSAGDGQTFMRDNGIAAAGADDLSVDELAFIEGDDVLTFSAEGQAPCGAARAVVVLGGLGGSAGAKAR